MVGTALALTMAALPSATAMRPTGATPTRPLSVERDEGHAMYAWGNNFEGQLGDGTTTQTRWSPNRVGTGTDWSVVSAGGSHTAAIKTDSTLWTWGANNYGQLGDGTTNRRTTPAPLDTGTDWSVVSAGPLHTAAITTNGTLWTWGYNSSGALGDGTTTDRRSPIRVGTAADWRSVAAGYQFTIGIKTDGTLWSWGLNDVGQVGDGTATDRWNPIEIGSATDWAAVSAGADHAVALKTDGTLWAWGSNEYRQLGDGTTAFRRLSPTRVGTSAEWAKVDAGGSHTVALRNDGSMWAWGSDNYGQLGNGIVIPDDPGGAERAAQSPTRIGVTADWSAVGAGYTHTSAIKTDGTLWSWGYNGFGALGNGSASQIPQTVPARVGGSSDWAAVAVGSSFTVALRGPTQLPTVLAEDGWSRSVVSGWGSADVGGAYANKPGEVSSFAVAGGVATMRVPASGTSRQTWLPEVLVRDVDAVVSVSTATAASGPYGNLVSIALRRQAVNTEYRARLRFGPGGNVFVATTKATGTTTETFIGSEVVVSGVIASPGVPLRMRVQVAGAAPTTLRVRVWSASATEPSTWQLVRANSEPVLQSPGSVGLMGYVSGSATTAPVVFSFDNLEIRNS